MNRLADAMEPYLTANTIRFNRNTPQMTAASSIAQANQGEYDFYLALHSNAAGSGNAGEARGIIAFYYPTSTNGKRAAELFAKNLRTIYPLPNLVATRSTTSLGEVRQPKAPANLLELGYHDNVEDARWIEDNIQLIAQNLVLSLTEYFSLPFSYPEGPLPAVVATASGGNLNLRAYPSTDSAVVAQMPDGANVTVYAQRQGWYTVGYGDQLGYAAAAYIQI